MEWIGALAFFTVLTLCGLWAYRRYTLHARAAQERSLAALNQLLREADELQQEKLRTEGIEPEQEDVEPEDLGPTNRPD